MDVRRTVSACGFAAGCAATTIALAVATGCSGDGGAGPGVFRIGFDTERPGSLCASESCEDYRFGCGATMLVRWTDPDTGEVAMSDTGEPLETCQAIEAADSLCALREMADPILFFGIPQETYRIEIALWSPPTVSATGCPGGELFDVFGVPRAEFSPQPAFAGATYVHTSRQDSITIELSCPDPGQLDDDSCQVDLSTRITAEVTDLERLLSVSDAQATNMTVSATDVLFIPDDKGGVEAVLDTAGAVALSLTSPAPQPTFSASTNEAFDDTVCTTVLELGPQATTSVHCDRVQAGARELDLSGLHLPKETLDEILTALGGGEFPEEGLVIGRVVDAAMNPVDDVAVTVGGGTVRYLSASRTSLIDDATSDNGFFVSTDAAFPASVTALHQGDGRREEGAYESGLIRGTINLILIRLEGDVIAP